LASKIDVIVHAYGIFLGLLDLTRTITKTSLLLSVVHAYLALWTIVFDVVKLHHFSVDVESQ
jgi:hypothetical protein